MSENTSYDPGDVLRLRIANLDIVGIPIEANAYDIGRASRVVGIGLSFHPFASEEQVADWKLGWIAKDAELGGRV